MIEPVLREKKRYIVFKLLDKKVNYETAKQSIDKAVIGFIGEKGYGESGIMLLKELWKGDKGVIRVANKMVNEIKTCLGLIKEFNTKTLKITGTIKKAKELIKE